MKPRSRVTVTYFVQIFLIVCLIATAIIKVAIPDDYVTSNEPKHTFRYRLFKGLGFVVKITHKDESGKNVVTMTQNDRKQYLKPDKINFKGPVKLTLNETWMSFQFEIAAIFVLCFCFSVLHIRKSRLDCLTYDPDPKLKDDEDNKKKKQNLI
jgi:hypothetical protein